MGEHKNNGVPSPVCSDVYIAQSLGVLHATDLHFLITAECDVGTEISKNCSDMLSMMVFVDIIARG